jgi:hypothetical protein
LVAPAVPTHIPFTSDLRFAVKGKIMRHQNAKETAQMMLRLHGLRAQAIAQERAAEMRQQGDTAGLDHWQQIHAAICEMRRTARSENYGESHADLRS